eukprot:scaffold32853_cov22-Prasinocladus_malaysianus.AAC.1
MPSSESNSSPKLMDQYTGGSDMWRSSQKIARDRLVRDRSNCSQTLFGVTSAQLPSESGRKRSADIIMTAIIKAMLVHHY